MTAARPKPIRIFYSPLSQRFYATRSYGDAGDGLVTVGSNNDDVTKNRRADQRAPHLYRGLHATRGRTMTAARQNPGAARHSGRVSGAAP